MPRSHENADSRLFAGVVIFTLISAACARSPVETPVKLLEQDAQTGLELWQTMLGPLWIPSPGLDVIRHLQWEQVIEKVYNHPLVHVGPGDVVIDCGAHIGGFTQTALRAGARLVVAFEPEEANLRALEKNLAPQIRTGQVRLIRKGVWDSEGRLSLHLSKVGDSHSLLLPQNAGIGEAIEVTTLDAVVRSLQLPRVDFIKMDIEGAEQRALQGARGTIARDHPRLAVSSYHMKGDPAAISGIVWQTRADYLVVSKDLVKTNEGVFVPKVLFFYRPN